MVLPKPTPRGRELIRQAAKVALHPTPEWLDELDRATLAAHPSIAADPALATVVSRANRSHLIHFATANLRKPGQPVPANLGPDPLRMARDLVRRGLDASALDVYRVGQTSPGNDGPKSRSDSPPTPKNCTNCSPCRFARPPNSSTPPWPAWPHKCSSNTTN